MQRLNSSLPQSKQMGNQVPPGSTRGWLMKPQTPSWIGTTCMGRPLSWKMPKGHGKAVLPARLQPKLKILSRDKCFQPKARIFLTNRSCWASSPVQSIPLDPDYTDTFSRFGLTIHIHSTDLGHATQALQGHICLLFMFLKHMASDNGPKFAVQATQQWAL